MTPYTLNDAAVVAHDLNLHANEIDALFAAVGIDHVCDRVRHADAVLDWYCASKGLAQEPQDGVPSATITQRIEDIVERRNQVAHRGGNPVDLLGTDEMSDTIGFIEALSKAVFAMVVAKYLDNHHRTPGRGISLKLREGPYHNGTIVVVEKPIQRLFVGQPVFVIIGVQHARWGRIQSLKVDEASVAAVEQGDAASHGIGIGLDFKCPKGGMVVALESDDDVVWSPPQTVVAAPAA